MSRYRILSILLLFTGSLYFSCDNSTEQELLNDADFFPMAIGSQWYYHLYSGLGTAADSLVYEITRTVSLNHIIYYEMEQRNVSNGTTDLVYYRMDSTILYSRTLTTNESIIADFSQNAGEPAYWDSFGDLYISQKDDETMVIERPFAADWGSIQVYTRNIGLTEYVQNGFILYTQELAGSYIANDD